MSGFTVTPAMSPERAREIAAGFDLRALPADFYANPFPVYAALRETEPVRRMPGMYTHTVHPLHIVQEAIDNAVDEALAGFGKRITVSVFKDGSVQVEDEGRGIPVDMHPVEKKPAVEVAFSMLHAGGKFSRSGDGVYHISGGLHGVGVAVSNALSGVNPSDANQLGQVPAGLLLALYAAIFIVAGAILMRRRDVTA